MEDETDPTTKRQVSVGLIADPGVPLTLLEKLAPEVPELLGTKIDDEVEWVVKVEDFSLPVDADGFVQLNESSSTLRHEHGWDYMVYFTDLPKYQLNEPLVASLNTAHGVGMITIPTLGLGRTRSLRRLMLQIVTSLHASSGAQEQAGTPVSVIGRVTTVDDGTDEPESLDTVETLKGFSGRLALLVGMVRSNTPLKLVPRLSSAIAGAIGTAAFGIFYASIWSMADYLSAGRMLLISLLSVATMSVWLLTTHGLWESPKGAHRRERRLLYNAATTTTVVIAVTTMYLVLFAVVLLGSLVVIDINYLGENLREEAGFMDYVDLAWLATSMGIFGGAIGSSFSDADVVRRGTFSNREYERRQIVSLERKKEAEEAPESAKDPQ